MTDISPALARMVERAKLNLHMRFTPADRAPEMWTITAPGIGVCDDWHSPVLARIEYLANREHLEYLAAEFYGTVAALEQGDAG